MVKNESTESLHDFPIIPLVSFNSTCDRFMVPDIYWLFFSEKTNTDQHRFFTLKKVRFSKPKSIKVLER